jgi:hypothetical protein
VVVVFILELFCKVSNLVWSSHNFKVSTCHISTGQPGQLQQWWSTEKLFTLTCSWMRCQGLTKFGLRIFNCRGAKWWRFYKCVKWPLSYVCWIWNFLWFEFGFFYAFVFVYHIWTFYKQEIKQWWPWLKFCNLA